VTATNPEFFDAIEQGNADLVQAMLAERPALIKQTNEDGLTPLMLAVRCVERTPQLVQVLIGAGADVNASTHEGYTPLHMMVDVNGPTGTGEIPGQIARLLVNAGADVEARQHWGWTPLMRAAMEGTDDELKALVDVGGKLNEVFPPSTLPVFLRGRTVLMATVGRPQKTQILIDAGVDVRAVDANGQTALEFARICLAEAGDNRTDRQGTDAMIKASLAATLKGLNAAGIDPDSPMVGTGTTYRESVEASVKELFAGAGKYDHAEQVRRSIAIIEKGMAQR